MLKAKILLAYSMLVLCLIIVVMFAIGIIREIQRHDWYKLGWNTFAITIVVVWSGWKRHVDNKERDRQRVDQQWREDLKLLGFRGRLPYDWARDGF